jgi:hypothetical protein
LEPEQPQPVKHAEPTPAEIISHINNTKLQIMEHISHQVTDLKYYIDSMKQPQPSQPPQPAVKLVEPEPPTKGNPWYKNWFAWVLSVIVLLIIGYSIYLLIMVESGKRIVLPW